MRLSINEVEAAIPVKFDQAVALHQQGKLADAERVCRGILLQQPNHFGALHLLGLIALQTRHAEEAVELFGKAIALNPEYVEAHYNRGLALMELHRPEDALASYDRAIALMPNLAMAYNNRGSALLDLKRPADALASYDRAIALQPDHAKAHGNRGMVLAKLRRYEEALAAYDKAFALDPDVAGVEGGRLNTKMRICDWSNLDSACARLISSGRSGKARSPFQFLATPSSSGDQLRCAKLLIAQKYPAQPPIWQGERYDHSRIRVAYLSPDFREHALSSLAAGMFECHDRSKFDVTAISFGIDDNS
jgi:protein O-GlcNAc transferase